jgi:ABC-2 type transport system ATP-binding protein
MNYAIEINHLKKDYANHTALKEISFNVKKGSIHGFLGPNGAGKSTTMKILCGLIPPTSGDFKVRGEIGFLPEYPPLYGNMTVDDYLEFVLAIFAKHVSKNKINDVKEKTGLKAVGKRLIGNISKGFQQRVGVAQAIVHSPQIIILDEPTVGLDPVAVVEIRELINSLKSEHTILFSSHQLHEVELLCSDITLINQGSVLVSGELREIQKKFATQKSYKAILANYNDEIKNKIIREFDLDSISVVDNQIELFPKTNTRSDLQEIDKRLEITRFLARPEIGLLEFREEKLALEEIFKRMTIEGA